MEVSSNGIGFHPSGGVAHVDIAAHGLQQQVAGDIGNENGGSYRLHRGVITLELLNPHTSLPVVHLETGTLGNIQGVISSLVCGGNRRVQQVGGEVDLVGRPLRRKSLGIQLHLRGPNVIDSVHLRLVPTPNHHITRPVRNGNARIGGRFQSLLQTVALPRQQSS